jgi:uncharacterized membrane protein
MRKTVLLLSVAALLGISADAHAKGWRVCNRTAEDLYVAIAYKDAQDQWISKGWHDLRACGGCALVMNHSRTEYTGVYVHAKNHRGDAKFGNDARFCVTSGAFTVRNLARRPCGSGFTVARFSKQVIADEDRDFVTHLRGSAGGRTCID